MSNFNNSSDRTSWLHAGLRYDFHIQNIPFVVFFNGDHITTIGSRVCNNAIDLAGLHQLG